MLDVYVISLIDSPRRRAIESTLRSRGIDFHFEDAFDARGLNAFECEALSDRGRSMNRYGRALSKEEIGCFISHREVWKRIVARGRAAIVLEDDALLDDAFFQRIVVTRSSNLELHADLILLGRSKLSRGDAGSAYLFEPLRRARKIDGLKIGVPFKQWTSGAVGYWISAIGACKALAYAEGPIHSLLDDWPWHRDYGELRVAELRPYVVWEGFETMPSAIEEGRAALSGRRKIIQELVLKPLRVMRAVCRWLVVLAMSATVKRKRLFDSP